MISNQTLNKIIQHFGLPDFVKSASSEQLWGTETTTAFADISNRQYPCHTKAAVWVSLARRYMNVLEATEPRDTVIDSRVKAAAQFFNLTEELAHLEAKTAELLQPLPLTDNDYALVFTDINGKAQKKYRLSNIPEVKTAAAYLQQYGPHFSVAERQQMAEKILVKAAALNVTEIDKEWLGKQAGRGFCTGKAAAELLFSRAKALHFFHQDIPAQIELAEIAKACLENPGFCHNENNLRKMASLIDTVDREYRLDRLQLPAPEDVLFSLTMEKLAAAQVEHVALQSGSVYAIDDLRRVLDYPTLENGFGTEIAKNASDATVINRIKLAETLPKLSRTHAQYLDSILYNKGIQPVHRQGGTPQNILRDNLEELAAVGF